MRNLTIALLTALICSSFFSHSAGQIPYNQDVVLFPPTPLTEPLPADTLATPVTPIPEPESSASTPVAEPANDYNNTNDTQSVANNEEEQNIITELEDGSIVEIISFGKIFSALLFIGVVILFLRFVVALLESLSERFNNYRLLIKRFIPILRVSTWAFATYFLIAGIFNPPIETIITVSATIGIAVGFASQDILRNIFGGMMIILDRPFQVGDKIDIGGHYGEVIEIGLRSVRIVTPDDSVISVPNGELMNKAVSNTNSSALDCQVVSDIFLPLDVDVQEMRRLGRRAAITSRYVYLNKPIVINILNETKANKAYMVLRVKAYVLDIRYEFRFKSDVTELIMQELSQMGISGRTN
ncbi:MAG: mechanosensitive ion channel family protein [Balneolales bacterium]|nr:mechanosensitive ion channel family protein [Balneolales bacterium]